MEETQDFDPQVAEAASGDCLVYGRPAPRRVAFARSY